MKYVLQVVEENESRIQQGLRVACFVLASSLFFVSRTNVFLEQFLNFTRQVAPKPVLEPIVCRYRPPGQMLKRTIALFHPDGNQFELNNAVFSDCNRYVVVQMRDCLMVFDMTTTIVVATRDHSFDGPVKFNWDGSKIALSDGLTILVWN